MNAHARWLRFLGLGQYPNDPPLGAHAQALKALSDQLARRPARRAPEGRCALVMPDQIKEDERMTMETNELRTTSSTIRNTEYLLRRLWAAETERDALERERDALKARLERLATLRVCGKER